MPKAILIGCGNPLRGDDGVGWQIVQQVQDLMVSEQVTFLTCHQLTPELAEQLSQAELAIFVDACVGEPQGAVRCQPVQPLPSRHLTLSHHFSPSTLLGFAQQFFGKAPKAFLVSINGANFGYKEGLSPLVAEALPCAVQLVLQLLRNEGFLPESHSLNEQKAG